ncbi:tRNA (uridine(34)/cytosine(34)/5-carboxymethylaminomethyluridine(34)-2'-O)-methyltransferase TrmL [Pseudodesulfovibrio cashew]|uniref:Putative tRNA (cytidine(34)-2'-O)-methyltransferase n=1 Tax=Pseudodesulfovibrio cashew TaxID=2678688 RepID=A0A6I6JDP8_9BACT|nr:tRNA (uridine(34)/cytosine(34)/5-carboxymethylaminomethyluridine(34)-2'-O)-methyltransferase TrmL [Pseudodesulfovibrio cashew]QGY40965.1 tRNA (uridine(34)/cytosine(34)/5-carboxymethylaminomethyluridine(34)-2'-O)-methyltransferase TrmL [Pseudodesulfovibrio cashew]
MRIVLFEPEIPPNTGNIARLCAATKTPLHLIEPLGFKTDDKHLKRAGLDYWEHVKLTIHPSFEHFVRTVEPYRLVMASTKASVAHQNFQFQPIDTIVMGPETRGLPQEIMALSPHAVRIPIWGEVRSLNLSTATGILLYEAMRQTDLLPD